MRSLRSWVVLVSLCLCLGASVASAAEAPAAPAGREVGGMVRILGQLGAFLKVVWEAEGCMIDPWGRCSPGTDAPDPDAPSTDSGCHIDPWGGCDH